MYKYFFIVLFIFSFVFKSMSQEQLPDFSIIKSSQNRTVISWKNNLGDQLNVLNIQRSSDSLRNFRTIYASPNASLNVNAFTDNHPEAGQEYYRIFYTMKNGAYYFTKAKRVSSGYLTENILSKMATSKQVVISGDESNTIPYLQFKRLADSVLYFTTDSLIAIDSNKVLYKKSTASVAYVAPAINANLIPVSSFIYLNNDGNVVIRLPENDLDSYSMIIYDTDGRTVFSKINRFSTAELILSKSSFFHQGWYPYEIFKNGQLKEKSRFLLK